MGSHPRTQQPAKRRAAVDLIILGCTAALAFLLASRFEIFEWLARWSRAHEDWQLDEIFTVLTVLSFGLGVFALRRWREARNEARDRQQAEAALAERTQQLEAVRSVGEEIARELNLPAALDLITRRALDLLGASSAVLRLWDEAAELLIPQSRIGMKEPGGIGTLNLRLGEGVAGTVAQRRQGLVVNDFRHSPYAMPAILARTTHTAVLAEPLLYRDRLVGVISLNREEIEPPFTEEDRQLLALFADQAAIAIENARLYEEAQRAYRAVREQAGEVAALHEIGTALASSLDLNAVLETIVESATRLAGAHRCAVFELDPSDQRLHVRVTRGMSPDQRFAPMKLGQGAAGYAARQRELYFNRDILERDLPMWDDPVDDQGTPLRAISTQRGYRAILAVPLLSRDQVFGSICIYWNDVHEADEREVRLLTALARPAAIAMEKARLHHVVLDRAEQLATLSRLTQSVLASLDVEAVARQIMAAVQALIPGVAARLWNVREDDAEMLELIASVGLRDAQGGTAVRFRRGEGLAGLAVSTRRPMTSRDVREDPRFVNRTWAAREGLVSAILFPLIAAEQIHGILVIFTREPHEFSDTEVSVFQALASHAAIAMENARLFAEVERRNRELQALFSVADTVTRSLDIASITQAALRTTLAVLHLDAGRVYISDKQGQVLRLIAHHGLPPEVLKDFECYAPQQGIIGRIFQEGRPMVFADITADPTHAAMARSRLGIQLGFRSAAGLPILAQGRPEGVIYVFGRAVREFTPGDLALLTAIGGQIGIAIENARLDGEIQEHAATLETRVKERTAELEEALRVKSRFLGTMSHELRTPLNAILGFSELLMRQEPDRLTPRQERYAQLIHRGGQQLLGLVSELLEMAEAQTGRGAFHLECLPAAQFLGTVVESLAPAAKEKQVKVQTALDPGLPAIVADRRKLAKALHHVVSNAIRFTPAGGGVTISTGRVSTLQGEEAEIAIADTGIGIRPADLERIFQPFEQADPSETRHYGGAGLGLAVVRYLVGLHGGRVWAESDGEGHGAHFIIRLPLPAAPLALRILVAGDGADGREALSATLTDAGYEAEQVPTGAGVLERLAATTFGLLVLDIGLPDGGGGKTLTDVRERDRLRKLPVLVLAGTDSMTREEALALGTDEFLTKPVSPRALVETVALLLARSPVLGLQGKREA